MDATIIDAPSSTKNGAGVRDADMHQTKKGNEWKLGLKAHIGVDDDTLRFVREFDPPPVLLHEARAAETLFEGLATRPKSRPDRRMAACKAD